jgi:KaiC/GvpD/RAD55 family RecA-like ATPase
MVAMLDSKFGIPMIDEALPEGFPRESFVILFGEGGTGKTVTLLQVTGERLKAGMPCVFVTFDDSPASIIDNLRRLGFDPDAAFRDDLLHIVDGFSFRSRVSQKVVESINFVPNPRDRNALTGSILTAVNSFSEKGTVIIDSLTELFTMSEPSTTIETIKDWRAQFCKSMGLTVFASYHIGVKAIDEFAVMLEYVVDGIVDFRFDPLFAQQGVLARQLRVKKMKGTTHDTLWHYFTIDKNGLNPIKSHAKGSSEDSHKLSK